MAKVTVHFSGPMLFLIFEDRVEVIIPKSEVGRGAKHPDGSRARPHYAWLTAHTLPIKGHVDFKYREALIGADVTFGGATELLKTRRLRKRFDLTVIAKVLKQPESDPLAKPWARSAVAARVTLRNGAFVKGLTSNYDWDFRDNISRPNKTTKVENPDYDAVWETENQVNIDIRYLCDPPKPAPADPITSAERRFDLAPDGKLRIDVANLDPRAPENWGIPSFDEIYPAEKEFIDHDFKWIYRLFDLSKALPAVNQRHPLPAPILPPAGRISVGGRPSCHNAFIDMTTINW